MFMVADNQGSHEPSCPLHLVRRNRFYGHKQNAGFTPNWAQTANAAGTLPYDPPVAWMLRRLNTCGAEISRDTL
jgi:hypothetical protein